MTHEEVLDALGAYVDGELEAPRRAALEAHLATCAECRGELAALHELDRALGAQPVPDPGSHYWARFADRVVARTGGSSAAEGARFYERLTGWLFPHERFAWARAATAIAACTLLLTLGLHGFRTVGTRPGQLTDTGRSRGAPPAPELNLPPGGPAESHGREVADRLEHPVETSPPGSLFPAPESESAPRADVAAPMERAEERVARPAPRELAAADEPAAPQESGEAKRQGPEAAPPAGPPGTAPPTIGFSRFATGAPAAKGVLDSLAGSRLYGRKLEPQPEVASPVRVEGPTPSVESGAAVESLLARDARLWPRRDHPDVRSQIETLATDLADRARDPRLRARAQTWLEYLLATSVSEGDRERWERLLGSLPEP